MTEAAFTLCRVQGNHRVDHGTGWPAWNVKVNGITVAQIRPTDNQLWTVFYDTEFAPTLTFRRSSGRDVKGRVLQPSTSFLDTIKADILANLTDILAMDRALREEADAHRASLPPTDAEVYASLRDGDFEP